MHLISEGLSRRNIKKRGWHPSARLTAHSCGSNAPQVRVRRVVSRRARIETFHAAHGCVFWYHARASIRACNTRVRNAVLVMSDFFRL